MTLTPAQRSLHSRIAAAESWAATADRSARTAPARQALRDRFVRLARERFGDLPEAELVVRAEQLRKAHYARLAFKSSVARSKAKTVKQDAR
jgi:hypothetical protein